MLPSFTLDLIVGLEGVSRSNLNFCCLKYSPPVKLNAPSKSLYFQNAHSMPPFNVIRFRRTRVCGNSAESNFCGGLPVPTLCDNRRP